MKKFAKGLGFIARWIFLGIPAFVCSIFVRPFYKDLWLVGESGTHARDNGYYFFKYLRENQPQQKAIFLINRKSPDYQKVAKLGKVCQPKSFMHWLYFFVSKKLISSHTYMAPNYYISKRFWPNKAYFLQHGIIKDVVCYTKDNFNFKLFVTSAQKEYDFILNNYGFDDSVVKLVGMPRYDSLSNFIVNKNQILVIPTWRTYLSNCTEEQFKNSNYFKAWSSFLNNKNLHNMLNKNNKKVVFYPHIEMQKFTHLFESFSENIVIVDAIKKDVQELLKESALLITDYSSVYFDFAYMQKPVLWYQFDEKEFFNNNHNNSYFNYRNNILGVYCQNEKDLLKEVEVCIQNKCMLTQKQINDVKSFFAYFDANNCERVYREIKNIK